MKKWICTSISSDLHILTWEFRLDSLGLWSQCLVIENGFLPTNHKNLIITDIEKGMFLLLQYKPCAVYSESDENNLFFWSGILSVITVRFRTPGLMAWSFHRITNPFSCQFFHPDLFDFQGNIFLIFSSQTVVGYLVAKSCLHSYCFCLHWD